MSAALRRVPWGLLIAAAILFPAGLVARYLIATYTTPKQLAQNVFLNAVPFVLMFVAVLLVFIALVVFVSRTYSGNMRQRTYKVGETIVIGCMLFGIVGIFQPWIMAWYTYGFVVLLIATLAFIVWSHIAPRLPVYRGE